MQRADKGRGGRWLLDDNSVRHHLPDAGAVRGDEHGWNLPVRANCLHSPNAASLSNVRVGDNEVGAMMLGRRNGSFLSACDVDSTNAKVLKYIFHHPGEQVLVFNDKRAHA